MDKYAEYRQAMDDVYKIAIAAEVHLMRQIIDVDLTPKQKAAHPLRQRIWLEDALLHNYQEAMHTKKAKDLGVHVFHINMQSFRDEREKEIAYLDSMGL